MKVQIDKIIEFAQTQLQAQKSKSAIAYILEFGQGQMTYQLYKLLVLGYHQLGDLELTLHYNQLAIQFSENQNAQNFHRSFELYLLKEWTLLITEFGDVYEPIQCQLSAGKAFLEVHNYPRAIRCFQAYFRVSGDINAKFLIGKTLGASGKTTEAIKILQEFGLICEEPLNASGAWLLIGLLYISSAEDEKANYKLALENLEKALYTNPNNQDALGAISFVYRMESDWENLETSLTNFMASNPDPSKSSFLTKNSSHVDSSNFDYTDKFESLIPKLDGHKFIYVDNTAPFSQGITLTLEAAKMLRGASRSMQQKYNEAIDDFKSTSGYKLRNDPRPFLDIATILQKQKKYSESLQYFDLVIHWKGIQNGLLSWAYHNLGVLHFELKNWDEVINASNNSLEINPNFNEPNINKAVALWQQGKISEAKSIYSKLLE